MGAWVHPPVVPGHPDGRFGIVPSLTSFKFKPQNCGSDGHDVWPGVSFQLKLESIYSMITV